MAIVNGQKITRAEFVDRLEKAQGKQVLSDLILRALIEDAFTKSGLTLTDEEIETKEMPPTYPAKGAGTILVIEDEDLVTEAVQALLERLGYRVLTVKSGSDAIHLVNTHDGEIDLALLDIKLPDMEGGNLYPLLMKARPHLKVIVCSGYAIDGPAQRILDAEAQGFIQKPFTVAVLAEKVRRALEHRQG